MTPSTSLLPSTSSSSMLFESIHLHPPSSKPVFKISSSSRNHVYIPKLEPFSGRTKLERGVKGPSFIEKSEADLSDYCSVLEGDDSFNCWRAYFELKDLEKELPKDELERLIHETEGAKSLISCVHGVSEIHKMKNRKINEHLDALQGEKYMEKSCPIPDGLPRSEQEMAQEENDKMVDSAFTRLLRTMGSFPAWFSQTPDHETD